MTKGIRVGRPKSLRTVSASSPALSISPVSGKTSKTIYMIVKQFEFPHTTLMGATGKRLSTFHFEDFNALPECKCMGEALHCQPHEMEEVVWLMNLP